MLLAELSQIETLHKDVINTLPTLVTCSSHQHYTQHFQLLETFCQKVMKLIKNLNNNKKKNFQNHNIRYS